MAVAQARRESVAVPVRRRHLHPLQKAREHMELSQREVAVYAGCSQQSFSRYEAGVATPPKAYRIRICKLLHVAETALWTAAEMARADGARLQRSA